MVRKIVAASGFVVGLVCIGAIPAWAHVTVAPDSAPQGASDTEITFRVPNEEATASTTKLQIALPTSPPVLNALAQTVPGWKAAVVTNHLSTPIQTDDGPVTDVVSEVTWTADSAASGIPPGSFGRFEILVGTLPKTGNQIVFKALQTYSNGDVVKWIDPVNPNGPAAPHPTPILNLTSPTTAATTPSGGTTPATTPAAAASTTGLAKTSQVDSARTVGIVGIIIGAIGLIVGGAALGLRRRPA
jgi:uncharacterized protein YcnI